MSKVNTTAALAVALWAAVECRPAAGETLLCTMITSIPYTITQPGAYCLDRNLTMASDDPGAAITIAVPYVVLDLNGFTLQNNPPHHDITATIGIHAVNRWAITVRNGTVRGFLRGVYLQGSGSQEGHVVEGIQADGNQHEGIAVEGAGTIVRGNRVLKLGGSGLPGHGENRGIRVMGAAAQVLDNQVFEVQGNSGGSRGYGIYVNSAAAVVQGNRIANARELTEEATAIAVLQPYALVIGNRISWMDRGLSFEGTGAGKYRDNVTVDVGVPYSGGTDAGNNH